MSRKSEAPLPQNRRRAVKPERRLPVARTLGLWGWRVAEISLLVAAVVGLVVLGRWTHAYVTTSPYFCVGEAEVTGNSHVPPAELQSLSGLEPGTNIFAFSPAEAARRIETSPWIRSARVRRRLPDELAIEVVEREAVAIVRLEELHLIDGDGNVFKELAPGDPTDLPIITGIGTDGLEGEGGARADLDEALALLRLYEESGLAESHPLSEVHVEQDGCLSIYTMDRATHVRLGRPPFRRRLRRIARLFRELHHQRVVADYVYLEEGDGQVLPDRAVVRLFE